MDRDGHTHRGKWSEAGVPKKGWICVGVEDLEEPSQLCEMCESAEIRYAHVMEHSDYPGQIQVGCVCAENMEEDYKRPREREKRLKNSARRRAAWPSRKWRMSMQGNLYINTDGLNLTIYRTATGWSVRVLKRASGAAQNGKKVYPTEGEAKLAAFNALLWAQDHL
jgi:hypothetical protein